MEISQPPRVRRGLIQPTTFEILLAVPTSAVPEPESRDREQFARAWKDPSGSFQACSAFGLNDGIGYIAQDNRGEHMRLAARSEEAGHHSIKKLMPPSAIRLKPSRSNNRSDGL